MAEYVITSDNLVKYYGKTKALDGLSLRVGRGIFGFLGPNAAGKTTMIKILIGLVKPTSGEVHVLGLDPSTDSLKIRRRVGYLPENPVFYTHMSGWEYLDFVAKLRGIPREEREKQISALMEKVGLSDSSKKKVGSYSRGMLQRLAIAQAIIGDPELLLFDEPTTSLDPIGREEILSLIKELNKEGGSFFISSHILGEVERVCDHIAIINKGLLVTQGSVEEIKARLATARYRLEVSRPEEVRRVLLEQSYAKDAWIEGGILIVIPSDEREFRKIVPRILFECQAELIKLERIVPTLQEAFISLVREA